MIFWNESLAYFGNMTFERKYNFELWFQMWYDFKGEYDFESDMIWIEDDIFDINYEMILEM